MCIIFISSFNLFTLSDNSFNYPFLRVQTSLGKLHYTNLFAELQDISYFATNSIENVDQMGYPKKYMSSQLWVIFSITLTD